MKSSDLAIMIALSLAFHYTGPCTATCSHGAKYNNWSLHCHLQPWSQIQQLVLALPFAAVEPNTTSGPCTATCSRGARYKTGPCAEPNKTSGPCTANAAVEPGITTVSLA